MSIFTTFAQVLTSKNINIPNGSANDVLVAGLHIVYFLAGVIAVIVIIISGFRLVTNGGEPDVVKKARNSILFAGIGIVVIITAFTVTQYIIGRFPT